MKITQKLDQMPVVSIAGYAPGDDLLYTVETLPDGSQYRNYFDVNPRASVTVTCTNGVPLSVSNLTPLVCDASDFPIVEKVAPGLGRVLLNYAEYSVLAKLKFPEPGSSVRVPIGHSTDPVLGAGRAFALSAIGTYGRQPNIYIGSPLDGVRNQQSYAAAFDLSGVPVWNSSENAARKFGTLITPRHAFGVAHYQYPVGTVLKFVRAGGGIHQATVIAKTRQPEQSTGTNERLARFDAMVYLLDDDVPEDVAHYAVADDSLFAYHDGKLYHIGVLLLFTHRNECVFTNRIIVDGDTVLGGNGEFAAEINGIAMNLKAMVIGNLGYNMSSFSLLNVELDETISGYLDALVPNPKVFRGTEDSGSPVFLVTDQAKPTLYGLAHSKENCIRAVKVVLDALISEVDGIAVTQALISSPTGYSCSTWPSQA